MIGASSPPQTGVAAWLRRTIGHSIPAACIGGSARITKLGRVMVPVSDQDQAISFYTTTLGFSVLADVPFGEGDRWVEVAPRDGGAALALVRTPGRLPAGAYHRHRTGVS
ncbi:MAG: VOC family protein [Candidatus Dormibacteria bacterium]